jgi:1-acyl-sn-glycerol-3-phosphate acyltransferase
MSNPYPINPVLKIVVKIWMTIFTWYYKITANISPELIEFDQPYLLLSNHYGRYDPFIISNFIKKRPNFISSDAILRDRIIGTLFKGLGAMPKKKGVRDTHIIREMVKVVRSGGALALFPEGARTWSGETLFIDPSIAKLVKLLGIPVITAQIKGAYSCDPRWANIIRRSAFEIDFNLMMGTDEIKSNSEETIYNLIQKSLYQDDTEYQRTKRTVINSNKRAEHLDLVLFQCPDCKGFRGFESSGNQVVCKQCSKTALVDKYGFLTAQEDDSLPFDSVKQWFGWQNKNFVEFVNKRLTKGTSEAIIYAENMQIEYAIGEGRMKKLGVGKLYFYLDRLIINCNDEEKALMFNEITSFGPQFNERIELFYKDRAYRFTSVVGREPGIKWELAINVIWASSGGINKLSPYFKDLVLSAR